MVHGIPDRYNLFSLKTVLKPCPVSVTEPPVAAEMGTMVVIIGGTTVMVTGTM